MLRLSGASSAALFILGVGQLCAQSDNARSNLKGRILDDIYKQAIPKARAILSGTSLAKPSLSETDSAGTFSFSDLITGQYQLVIEKAGFAPLTRQIRVDPAEDSRQEDIVLIQLRSISGKVSWRDGDPASKAAIQLMLMVAGRPEYRQGLTARSYMTNERGEYSITGLRPGRYVAVASYSEVADADGFPPRIATPVFFRDSRSSLGAASIDLTNVSNAANIDFALTEENGVTVEGTVTPTAAFPLGTPLFIGLRIANSPVQNLALLRTHAGESFRFVAVPPGDYLFLTTVDNRELFRAFDLVKVGAEPVKVSLTMPEPRPVAGKVRFEEFSSDPAPRGSQSQPKVTEFENLYMKGESAVLLRGGTTFATSDRQGAFAFTDVAQGTYYSLEFQRLPPNSYVASVSQMGTAQESGFGFTANGLPVDIVLRNDGGTISGTVRDDGGRVVSSAFVVLAPIERRARIRFAVTNADSSGSFIMPSIAPGNYELFAFDSDEESSYLDPDYLTRYTSRATKMTVAPKATLSVDPKIIEIKRR